MIIKTLDKDLDLRDKWLGIRQLKSDYQPNPMQGKQKTVDTSHKKTEHKKQQTT